MRKAPAACTSLNCITPRCRVRESVHQHRLERANDRCLKFFQSRLWIIIARDNQTKYAKRSHRANGAQ
jgi:hypothetical protein